eukprot:CAMPEP_0116823746 /NCGR_PEP_ID=MMETSP0418-20121206/1010_1 /TAXON_ID=1158023 /ORGANISM="Astrosyne radiata, Strain 13vi08-1A" /LENGTH=352 /DNA_ID=CAMNT_0004452035 /DNA_START=548 /DNA_END=1606 /DNA_ORIENTATION=-
MNCSGGICEYVSSDDCDSTLQDDDESCSSESFEEESADRGIVAFVSGCVVQHTSEIRHPCPIPKKLAVSMDDLGSNSEAEPSDAETGTDTSSEFDDESARPQAQEDMALERERLVEDQILDVLELEFCRSSPDLCDAPEKHTDSSSTCSSTVIDDEDKSTNDGTLGENNGSRMKRILSSSEFSTERVEVFHSPKRTRCTPPSDVAMSAVDSTGESDSWASMPQGSLLVGDALGPPVGNEGDEYDRQLSEELEDESRGNGESSPVPLLTPPASPLCVDSDQGITTVCEWPSNLAVDTALTAAFLLRPASPSFLVQLECEEEERIQAFRERHLHTPSTNLAPLMQGVYLNLAMG